jgi:hypothetical protein
MFVTSEMPYANKLTVGITARYCGKSVNSIGVAIDDDYRRPAPLAGS